MGRSLKLIASVLVILSGTIACAQIPAGFVKTTATVNALANGTFGAAWTNLSSSSQLALLGGLSTFQQTVNGNLDSSGKMSVLLADTSQIVPSPSTWTFTFTYPCGNYTSGGFSVAVAVTGGGGTEDISSQITAALPTNPCNGSTAGYLPLTGGTITGNLKVNGTLIGVTSITDSGLTSSGIVTNTSGGLFGTTSTTGTGNVVLSSAPLISGLSVNSFFNATGLVTNSDLVSASITVNSQTCTLGGNCTITAMPTSLAVGTTPVSNSTSGYVLYNNGNILGNLPTIGTGNVMLSTNPTLTASLPSSTTTGVINYGTLSYSDSGMVETYQSSMNGYIYNVIQNTNTGASASACYLTANSNTVTSNYYGEFCMNGSGLTGTGALNVANNVTFDSYGEDLVIGTFTANPIHFVVNNGATDSATVSSAGAWTFNGNVSSANLTVTSSFTATGLVTNADLVNSSTTVNGQTCTLGGSCTLTGLSSTSVSVGTTTVVGSTTSGYILYNNSGVLGNLATTGTGNVVLAGSPTITGTLTTGNITESSSGVNSFTVTGTGSTNNALAVLEPSLSTGTYAVGVEVGTAANSINNSLIMNFNNAGGSGSTSNFGSLAIYGTSGVAVYGTGDVAIGGFTDCGSKLCVLSNAVGSRTTITTGTSAVSTTCSSNSATAATLTGVTSTSHIGVTPQSDPSSVTGWASGSLFIVAVPSSNTVTWRVCNASSGSITPGSSITWNVVVL